MSNLRSLLENQEFVRIPLQKTITLHYKVRAKINDCWGDFIVDTGASSSCLNLERAAKFKLQLSVSDIKATGAGAGNLHTELSHKNTIVLGNWRKKNCSFIVMDLSHVNAGLAQVEEAPVDGILGADLLKSARAVIDYGRNCMYLK